MKTMDNQYEEKNYISEDALCVFNRKGIINMINDEFEKLTGFSNHDLFSENIHDLIPRNELEEFQSNLASCWTNKRLQKFNLNITTKSGKTLSTRWELTSGEINMYAFITYQQIETKEIEKKKRPMEKFLLMFQS